MVDLFADRLEIPEVKVNDCVTDISDLVQAFEAGHPVGFYGPVLGFGDGRQKGRRRSQTFCSSDHALFLNEVEW